MPTQRESQIEFWVGAVIVVVTGIAQAVILFNNASYTLSAFGTAVFTVYLSAALCYIILPWVTEQIENVAHIGLTRWCLLGFCVYIGVEEMLHASHGFQPPEGAMAVAGMFAAQESAKGYALTFVAVAIVAVIEVLWHMHEKGARLVKKNFRRARIRAVRPK